MDDDPVKFKGLAETYKFVDELEPKLRRNVLRGTMRAGMKPVLSRARANLRSHDRTGQLSKGLKIRSSIRGGVASARVRSLGPHGFIGRLLEYGVAAHIIRAKGDGMLSFLGIARKWIKHPGFGPKPWLRPALDTETTNVVLEAAKHMKAKLTKQGIETPDVEVDQ